MPPPIPLADEYMSLFRKEMAHGACVLRDAAGLIVRKEWEWGCPVFFRSGEPWQHLLRSGWSHAESTYTWSEDRQAFLELEAPPEHRDVLLRFACMPFLHGDLKRQRVRISHRGRLAASFSVAAVGETMVMILAPPSGREPLQLVWEFPDAASPSDLGMNGDHRKLAIALASLTATLV